MPDIDIDVSGPLFDGRADAVALEMVDDLQRTLAHQAYAEVMTVLNARIQHPTPYYETQVTVQRLSGSDVVHDRGIVYGPWLEGTSSRNASTSFKGYAAFRRGAEAVRAKLPALTRSVIDRWTRRME